MSQPAMDLKSGYPFWALKNGLLASFPPLQQDQNCDIAIVGAGITGALIAQEFTTHGYAVVVLDERDVAWGSTAASTALLQYEIDTHLVDLAKRYGEADAVLAYRACADVIEPLLAQARRLGRVDAERLQSLYYASRRSHAPVLAQEFALRLKHGFAVEWLDRHALKREFGVDASAGILNRPAGGIDPYQMAYRLLQQAQRGGARIYDRSRVSAIEPRSRDVLLRLQSGAQVRARQVVLAAGYSTQQWLQQRYARNRSSYAFVTEPIDAAQLGPLRNTMLWESARPYLYLRPSADARLVVGGEDDFIDIPARRDRRVESKARKLLQKTQALFPELPLQASFSWAGTFAETSDGLPYFGAHPQYGKRVLFAMAYGGNGITYSAIGAGLLRALVERRAHPLHTLFSFQRSSR
ncbi:glycine/D-amino acid oxidase-like deaminating enzyme [Tahibacter aquaticus]|uniref:Glycine/D-amino acid oxidase-like deaminating enzyme n=2 Tax=Tahibacter aquaticus TaxID=520092 RepID=A0A4R6YT41_9GAMM|nr:glycine/D-amino acid oxidase-like deaminating enzyme [Tahibacter aquaticus]